MADDGVAGDVSFERFGVSVEAHQGDAEGENGQDDQRPISPISQLTLAGLLNRMRVFSSFHNIFASDITSPFIRISAVKAGYGNKNLCGRCSRGLAGGFWPKRKKRFS